MSDYTTVFEISRSGNGLVSDTLFRVLIGLVATVMGSRSIIRCAKVSNRSVKEFIGPVFITVWGLLWLYLHYPLVILSTSKLNSLLEIGKKDETLRKEYQNILEKLFEKYKGK